MNGRAQLSVLLLVVLLLLTACFGEPRPVAPPGKFSGNGQHPVFVVNHGWHTGLVVEAPPAQQRILQLAERFGDLAYLEFGWGHRDFYETPNAGVWLALRAALWPGETVVRVVGIDQWLDGYLSGSGVAKLCVDKDELAAVLDFLAASFEVSSEVGLEGQLIPRGRSNGRDQFYNGAGSYHLANTCNVWTARALQSVGMDLSSNGKLTSGSVMGYLEKHRAVSILSRVGNPSTISRANLSCP